jgi:hypothetical protein
VPKDVFVWFDEPAPAAEAQFFEVVVTSHAYDGALAILSQARQGNEILRFKLALVCSIPTITHQP